MVQNTHRFETPAGRAYSLALRDQECLIFPAPPPIRSPPGRRKAALKSHGVVWTVSHRELTGSGASPSAVDIWPLPEDGAPRGAVRLGPRLKEDFSINLFCVICNIFIEYVYI